MPAFNARWQRVPEVFADDPRPGAENSVYCKGCGEPLADHARHLQRKEIVAVMMCEACQERHGHALMPASDAPSFCYRCGGKDEIFVENGLSPITYHVCPRCVPDRVARYRAGDFEPPKRDTQA
jgi:hypothetical protein